jgi:hypothetical protein
VKPGGIPHSVLSVPEGHANAYVVIDEPCSGC